MRFRLTRRITIATAAAVVLAGGAGAYAAVQGSGNDQQAALNDAAGRLGVAPSRLKSALAGALDDRLDAAVKAGRLTQTQANALKQRLSAGDLPLLAGPGRHHRAGEFGRAAATYIGITPPQLRSALESGKSLAQVATEHNKSVGGLEQAIEAAVRSRLDAAVSAKRITSAEEQQILARLHAHIAALVQRSGPPGRGFGHRPGFDGGPPPGAGFEAPGPPPAQQ